jgi:hypothetical protein
MNQITCRARVQVLVELDAGSIWDPLCPVEQVHAAASGESIQKLRGILAKSGVQIVGEPKVTVVLASPTDK